MKPAPGGAGIAATDIAPTLQNACERWPDRIAVSFAGRTLTYGDLGRQIGALADAYRRMGVRRGDRILCRLQNSPEYIVALHAAWEIGAIHAGVDSDLTGPELSRLARSLDPAVLLLQAPDDRPEDLSPIAALLESGVRPHVVIHSAADGAALPGSVQSLAALLKGDAAVTDKRGAGRMPGVDETALLLLTSGTTGRPKAFMENHPALMAKVAFLAAQLSPAPDDVHVGYLPLSHAFGLKLALMALHSGGRLVLMERFSPDPVLRVIREEGVTILPGTPTTFMILLQQPDSVLPARGSVRWAVSAAAPLTAQLVRRILERLTDRLFSVYGCSEGFLVVTTDTEAIASGAVGHTVFAGPPGTAPDGRLRIVRPDAGLPEGDVGEITFGAACPVRYWGEAPVATDGWYRSGDLGRIDNRGDLSVVGRIKEVVNRGGLKVGPWEVEQAVAAHQDALDCGVVALPHPVLGEAICACAVVRDGAILDLDALRAFLAPSLARHKLPDELCILPALPRSKTGKLDRRRLLDNAIATLRAAGALPPHSTQKGEEPAVG